MRERDARPSADDTDLADARPVQPSVPLLPWHGRHCYCHPDRSTGPPLTNLQELASWRCNLIDLLAKVEQAHAQVEQA